MNNINSTDSLLSLSYINLRRVIGFIGIFTPFVLLMGNLSIGYLFLEDFQAAYSISGYYHTIMRDVFVGSLCTVGVFLMSYRGYAKIDDVMSSFACVCAIGIALFPAAPILNPTATQITLGYVHYVFAAAFFLTLVYFALVLFRKTNPDKPMTAQKRQRNSIYSVCGYGMLVCMVLLVINAIFWEDAPIKNLAPVFWLETFTLVFFGVSWLIKGEAILKDK